MAEVAVEVKEAESRKKPTTWHGINLFQLQDNETWKQIVQGGGVDRLTKTVSSFLSMIRRVEEKTGRQVLDSQVVMDRINELRQAALGSALKEGAPVSEVIQQFDALFVSARSFERLEGVKSDEDSGVFRADMKAIQKAAREAAGEAGDDESEKFPVDTLSFAVSEFGGIGMIYRDIEEQKRPKAELSEEKDIILYPEDPAPVKPAGIKNPARRVDDDKQFLATMRRMPKSDTDAEIEALFRPEDRHKGWGVDDVNRSVRAELGLLPEVNTYPLQIEPLEPILIIPDQPEERKAS